MRATCCAEAAEAFGTLLFDLPLCEFVETRQEGLMAEQPTKDPKLSGAAAPNRDRHQMVSVKVKKPKKTSRGK